MTAKRYLEIKSPAECPRMVDIAGCGEMCYNDDGEVILCDSKSTEFPLFCPLKKVVK